MFAELRELWFEVLGLFGFGPDAGPAATPATSSVSPPAAAAPSISAGSGPLPVTPASSPLADAGALLGQAKTIYSAGSTVVTAIGGAIGDGATDAAVDVGVDAAVDVGTDAAVDVGVDAAVDVGVDAAVDVGAGAAIDVGAGAAAGGGAAAAAGGGAAAAGLAAAAVLIPAASVAAVIAGMFGLGGESEAQAYADAQNKAETSLDGVKKINIVDDPGGHDIGHDGAPGPTKPPVIPPAPAPLPASAAPAPPPPPPLPAPKPLPVVTLPTSPASMQPHSGNGPKEP